MHLYQRQQLPFSNIRSIGLYISIEDMLEVFKVGEF